MKTHIFTYEVGKPFPHEEYKLSGEGMVSLITTTGFNLLIMIPGIMPVERESIAHGSFRYGIATYENIPFILLDFSRIHPGGKLTLSFDATINLAGLPKPDFDRWVNSQANLAYRQAGLVSIYLVEQNTYILEEMRVISLKHNVATELREVLRKQYQGAAPRAFGQEEKPMDRQRAVDRARQEIQARYTTQQMIAKATMHNHVVDSL